MRALIATATLVALLASPVAEAQTLRGDCASVPEQSDMLGRLMEDVRAVDWHRVGGNALAFTEGAVVSFATGVAINTGIALAVATFPAWGTAIAIGSTIVGAGLAIYGGYQLWKNWDQVTEQDLYRIAGGLAGGYASSYVDPAKLPGVGRYIRNAARQKYFADLTKSESPRVAVYQESVRNAASIEKLAIDRYGDKLGLGALDKLRALGKDYEVLVSDPGIVMRLDDFVKFAGKQRKVAPWELRELYSKHLGIAKVYRGLALTQEQAAAMQKDGMVSGYLRPDVNGNAEWSKADPLSNNFFSMMKERIHGGGWGNISSAPKQTPMDGLMSVTFDRDTAFTVPGGMIKQAGSPAHIKVYIYKVELPTLDLLPGPVFDRFPAGYVNEIELFAPYRIQPSEIVGVEGPLDAVRANLSNPQ